jgi:hypothetical protein
MAMIISASRRTDIPAFHSAWFMDCLRQGFVEVKNPYNPDQVSKVSLSPDDVESIVFWTKNPAPLLAHLAEVEKLGHRYSFQFTLNQYPRDLEPGVPELGERIDKFIELSERIGPHNIVWRYDPIILSNKTGADYHRRAFKNLCHKLESRTHRVVVSLIDYYKKTRRNLKPLDYVFDFDAADRPETDELLGDLAKMAREHAPRSATTPVWASPRAAVSRATGHTRRIPPSASTACAPQAATSAPTAPANTPAPTATPGETLTFFLPSALFSMRIR